MQGIGQLLASSLLIASLLSVLAQNKDDVPKPSQLSKRSADDMDESSAPWGVTATGDDVSVAEKRFNEFVGKRAEDASADKRYEFVGKRMPYEFVGKRPYEFLGKRSPYEFLGKRNPYEFLGKRSPYEFLGKRMPYEFVGKRPYEFLGKRAGNKRALVDFYGKRVELPYEFVGKRIFTRGWQRLSANTIENDELVKDVTDVLETRDAGSKASPSSSSSSSSSTGTSSGERSKRYSEWLGKRSFPQLSDAQLRQMVRKRIEKMVRQRLMNAPDQEFVGRRELEEIEALERGSSLSGDDLATKKRYTEFVG